MSDMDIIKPVIAAAVGRHDASGPINTLPKAQAAIQKAVFEACRAVFQNLAGDDALKEGAVWRIAKTLAWAGVELVTDAWNDEHPDRGEAHELKGLWAANERLRKEEERLRKELNLQAVENIERTDRLLEERWTGLKARVAELEQELAEWRELRKFLPSGPAGSIGLRKARDIMEKSSCRTEVTGLVLWNMDTGERIIIDAGLISWVGTDEFFKAQALKHPWPAPNPATPCQGHAAQPDADGWIVWNGGPCPLKAGAPFQLKFRDGGVTSVNFDAPTWRWSHDAHIADIVAYRVADGGAA